MMMPNRLGVLLRRHTEEVRQQKEPQASERRRLQWHIGGEIRQTLAVGWNLLELYLGILILTLIGFGNRNVQMGLTLGWFAASLVIISRWTIMRNQADGNAQGKGEQVTGLSLLVGAMLSQLPGFTAVIFSGRSALRGAINEWANGSLEIWVSPFLPFWERLPAHSFHHFSDAYLAACATPLLLCLVFIGWSVTVQLFMGTHSALNKR